MEHWSIDDYKNFTDCKAKKSKYRANKTSIDGHTFDSKKEAEYYCELKYRLNNSLNSSATSIESAATPLKFLLMIRGS